MTKQTNDNGLIPVDSNLAQTYTTASGQTVLLRGVSPVLIERVRDGFTKKNPPPSPPTYTAEKAGGEKVEMEHTEATVETDAEKQALLDYQEAKEAWDRELNDRVLGLIAVRGVVIPQEDIDDPLWWDMQEMLDVEMPDKADPIAVRRHYIETEVIGSADDLAEILAQVMLMSGVDREVAETLRSLFRPNAQPEADNS